MARINLLPWRAELRAQKKREFGAMAAGTFILMLGVVGGAHLYVNAEIDYQNSLNNYLTGQIKHVEQKIAEIKDLEKKRQQLIDRMRVIERLQRNRPEVVHMFQELVVLAPDGLNLTSLKQKDKAITVIGEAQSNARVSSFMRAIDESAWFEKPQLDFIKSDAKAAQRNRSFTLRFEQTNPTDEKGK